MKKLLLLFSILFAVASLYAQNKDQVNEWMEKANSAKEQGYYQEATKYFELINGVYEKQNIKGDEYEEILISLTICYENLGEFEKAVKYGTKTLEIIKEIRGDNNPDYATILFSLAMDYSELHYYNKAIEYGTKAMEIRKEIFGETNPDYAISLNLLALFYSQNRNYEKAVELYLKAIEINKIALGENSSFFVSSWSNIAYNYSLLGDYAKAVEYGLKSIEINKETLGENHPSFAKSLNELANYYFQSGNYNKAKEYVTKAIGIQKKVLGETHPDYATSLNNLARCYSKLGNYEKAIEYGNAVSEVLLKSLGDNHPDYATSLSNLAGDYFLTGDFDKAIELGLKALNIVKTILGETHPDYASSMTSLSVYYSYLGELGKAREFGEKALDIAKTIFGEKHPEYATSLANLASVYSNLGDYTKSIEYGKMAIEIRKDILGEMHPDYAASINNLFCDYLKLGDFDLAKEYGIKSVEIIKTVYGKNHPQYATALNNLATYYSDIGDYTKAIEYGNRAMEIRKTILGETHPDYLVSLNNLALCYSTFGDFDKAIEYGTEAMEKTKIIFGDKHPFYANTLTNLAIYYSNFGNYTIAIEYVTKASEILKSTLGEQHPNYITALSNLSLYHSYLGDYDKAIEYGNMAMEYFKNTRGEKSPFYALLLNNLAGCYSGAGNYINAIEYGTKALEIRKDILGEMHPDYAISLSNLASYCTKLGEYSKALEYRQKSLTLKQSNILHLFGSLPSHQRTIYWSKHSIAFTDIYPSFSYKYHINNASDLYDKSALFAKGLLLTTEMEINRLVQNSGDEEAMKLFEELSHNRLQLQKLYETPIAKRNLNADSLAHVADQIEKRLIERSNVYGDFTHQLHTTWKDVHEVLNDDEMAVEFLSFYVDESDTLMFMVAALTLRKDNVEPKFIPLFELKQLLDIDDAEHTLSPKLTELVWIPLQKEMQGIRRIYFSPAGVLHKIAIENAPGMEDYEMYRLSTTREIIDMKAAATSVGGTGSTAALYGGVDYETLSGTESVSANEKKADAPTDGLSQDLSLYLHRSFVDSLNLRGQKVSYLPSTLTEVKNIQASLEETHRTVKVYVGPEATETSVKSLSGHAPNILHFATHGFYFTEKQARRKDNLRFIANDDQPGGNAEDKSLTRSGLFMAGANKVLEGENVPMDCDDGILTAQEISRLDLRGTDLVVLSACETGEGDLMQGEGVFGLQRSFKKAGAKTIVMSLWKVSDFPTEMLMTEFYKNICKGQSKHESLRHAQQAVREYKDSGGNYLFQNPHYWAGFVMLD